MNGVYLFMSDSSRRTGLTPGCCRACMRQRKAQRRSCEHLMDSLFDMIVQVKT